MFNMMNSTTGIDYGFITLWSLHVLSVVIFFTGVILLIALAIKTFNAMQLRNWAIGLIVAGTVICLFTIATLGRPWTNGKFGDTSVMQMQTMGRMMEMMVDHDEGMSGVEHDEHEEMEEMMRGMIMR